MNKKGNVTLYIIGFAVMFIILIVGATVGPLGVRMSTEYIVMGEQLLEDSHFRANDISNATVKAAVKDVIKTAQDKSQTNLEVSAFMYKYLWVITILITGFILFLASRAQVERTVGYT